MGGAFLAVSDDPSAIAHNPAGLTSLKGTNVYNGICATILSSKYISPNGHSEETLPQVFFPPNSFLTSDFGFDSVVFGLGIYSPFGIGGRKWSNSGLTRFPSTENLIGTAMINPTFAWRVLPQLSLGVGLDILYSSNTMATMVDQSLLAAGAGRLSFKGAGFGVGCNLGLLLFPGEKLSFAFAYRSAIRVNHEGSLALERIAPPLQPLFGGGVFRTDANIALTFPHKFSWGLAYRPTPKVTLALDLEWFWWSSFKRPTLDLKNEISAARLTDATIALCS
jgi:long-chain fatty acid transport protein